MSNTDTLKDEFKELLKTYPDIERKASDNINYEGEITSDYSKLQNASTEFDDKAWLCNSMFDVKNVDKEECKISTCSPLSFLLNEPTLTGEYWEEFQTECRDQNNDSTSYVYSSPTIEDQELEFRIPKDVIQKTIEVCDND